MEAMNLPKTSPFIDATQVPLPNDPPIQAKIGGQPAARGEEEEEEWKDSPSMRELAKQIDSHIVVVDLDNPAYPIAPKGAGTLEIALAPTAPSFEGASSVLPDVAQDPSI